MGRTEKEILLYANQLNSAYEMIQQKYPEEKINVKKAYYFAIGLLGQPMLLENNNLLAFNKYHFSIANAEAEERIEDEISHLSEKGLDDFSDMHEARDMGLIQRWMGGHTSAALDLLMKDGYEKRIRLALREKQRTKCKDKQEFYKAELIVLLAAQKRILQYAEEAKKQSETCRDKVQKEKYLRMVSACNNIAYNSPTSFFEAVQLIALTHEFCVMEFNGGQSQGIRLDQVLYPYYVSDLVNGRTNRKAALEIICSLWNCYKSFGERTANITLGGCTKTGIDMCNEITLICMEASIRVKANVPLLTLRVHPKLDEKVWDTAIELVRSGQGFPAFYNDIVAVKAKMNSGVEEEDAWDYSTLGCVEITIGGREYSHTEGIRINWVKLLELMLFDGTCQVSGRKWKLKEAHDLNEFTNFAQFYDWYKRELVALIHRIADFIDKSSMIYSEYWPTPYLSSITHDCLENGRDITANGTKYNNLSINCVGMSNAVDSLEVIERLIFKEQKVNFEQLKTILKCNFVGHEELRKIILEYPKYGNDIDSVDSKMVELVSLFETTVHNEKMIDKRGTFQCGFYSVMHHELLGKNTGASADGRLSKTTLASSLSPTQGMDTNGPTAVMNSVTKIPMNFMGNGGVLDLKFLPSFFDKKNHRFAFRNLIETYFEEGGLEVQFNVVDRQTLLEAQEHPEKHKTLVVRVSGYSAYFIDLSKGLQDEIIARTENFGV